MRHRATQRTALRTACSASLLGTTMAMSLPCTSTHRAATPALRLGGEWAGWSCAYNPSTSAVITEETERYCSDSMIEWGQVPAGFEVLTTENWVNREINRRTVKLLPEDGCNVENLGATVSTAVLPQACSGSTQLRPGASMMEPETLNVRAWALDAINECNAQPEACRWTLETVFDGIGGTRPGSLSTALECPAERTRVLCTFDVSSGTFVGAVRISQERCWSAAPSSDLTVRDSGRSGLDAAWVSSAVGLKCFGENKRVPCTKSIDAVEDATAKLALPGGVQLIGKPGLLEVTLKSGEGCRNSWSAVMMRRSWAGAGGEAGQSLFTEVETYDETMGDD